MKTIIVTTDLSEESHAAFGPAKQFARAFGSTIKLLAIIEDPAQAAMIYALDFPVYPEPDIQKQLAQKVTNDVKELGQTYFSDLPCETYVREAKGVVYQEILEFAKTEKADLIILATHGRTGLSRLLIGSVAERVVREASCAVLTVPVTPKT